MKDVSDETIKLMTDAAREHMAAFRTHFQEIASRSMANIVADYIPFIETDAWTNYRQYLQTVMEQKYMETAPQARAADLQWARNIRQRIYEENKEELTVGLVADLEAEIASLKKQLSERRW